jgi:drug/metabolite transporter (DMT)-like permease
MPYIGEIAGLATSALWAITSIFFAEGGKRIGSFHVNNIRLLMAVLIYALILTARYGAPYPPGVNHSQIFWLGLSGLVGLVFGDSCGFKALVMIGPRLTTLMYSTTPIWTTIVAWIFLGEHLTWLDVLGIAITIAGIWWVIGERRFKTITPNSLSTDHPDSGSLFKGLLLGAGAALGQAVGLVMAKQGMLHAGGTVEPIEASAIRMSIALIGIWLLSAARGQLPSTLRALRDIRAMGFTFGGAFFGPFLGVWMSLVAVRYIEAGIASTLNSMSPVMILPLLIFVYKERPSLRAWLGAIVAVIGVAILFLN